MWSNGILYMHCLVARKEAALQETQIEGFTEKGYGMANLEKVGMFCFKHCYLMI